MKIVIFECEKWEMDDISKNFSAHDLYFETEPANAALAKKHADADIISCFVFSDLSEATLQHFDQLKCITTRSTGFDHIGTDYCKENNIAVCNVPEYGSITVAEHVFALLLAVSRKIPEASNRTRRGDFSQNGLEGFDLCGKVMGFVGTGNIGKHAMRIAKGFGMQVLAYDIQPDHDFAAQHDIQFCDLDTLLVQSDIISLHVPENKHTHHMIDEAAFDKMKEGVVIINTARGTIMSVKALINAIATGKVAGAGLDVLPEEPVIREEAELLRSFFTKEHDLETLLADHILLHLRNVVITPHSGFKTKEAVMRILQTSIGNIHAFMNNIPRNQV